MKCIVNKLFIGALFLLGALVCSCQNTTENTVESSVAVSYTHLTLPTNSLV